MPITPFHFGPGLAVKAVASRWFSWSAFVASQVFIDFETLYYILTRQYPLHRQMHTFIGGSIAGLFVGGVLAAIIACIPQIGARLEKWGPSVRAEAGRRALIVGGFLGGASHPFLDGMMHPDIRPFAPLTDSNPLLGLVGLGTLHLACMLAGILGLAGVWARLYCEGSLASLSETKE